MPSEGASSNRKCPVCGQPRQAEYKPFCSRGCRDRDLLKWFGEGYRVPVAEPQDSTIDNDSYSDE